eukprot:51325-Eustigmatos_ZCMA.PRE.1
MYTWEDQQQLDNCYMDKFASPNYPKLWIGLQQSQFVTSTPGADDFIWSPDHRGRIRPQVHLHSASMRGNASLDAYVYAYVK